MSPTYRYPRPMVAVDVALFAVDGDQRQVLLIERGADPFKGQWALPGGFIEMDEELDAAARRELTEETGIEVTELREVGVYGRVGRDPRGRVISVVFTDVHRGPPPRVEGADDAAAAAWFALDQLPPLAFDHDQCVADAIATLADGLD